MDDVTFPASLLHTLRVEVSTYNLNTRGEWVESVGDRGEMDLEAGTRIESIETRDGSHYLTINRGGKVLDVARVETNRLLPCDLEPITE